jgi:hypothetical protein
MDFQKDQLSYKEIHANLPTGPQRKRVVVKIPSRENRTPGAPGNQPDGQKSRVLDQVALKRSLDDVAIPQLGFTQAEHKK